MYATGRGVRENDVAAHMWLNLAAAQLSSGEQREAIVKLRDFVAEEMTAAEITEAQRLAREWRPTPEPFSPTGLAPPSNHPHR